VALFSRKIGYLLSVDASAPEQFIQWGGLRQLLTMPILTAMFIDKVKMHTSADCPNFWYW
jgi:hypothetical protein